MFAPVTVRTSINDPEPYGGRSGRPPGNEPLPATGSRPCFLGRPALAAGISFIFASGNKPKSNTKPLGPLPIPLNRKHNEY